MSKTKITSFSVRKNLLKQLDVMRGDIPRSVYLTRLLEKNLQPDQTERKEGVEEELDD